MANRASDLLAAMRLADEFKLRLVLLGAAEGVDGGRAARQRARAGGGQAADRHPVSFDSLGATLENAARLAARRRHASPSRRSTRRTRATCARKPATRSPTAWTATPRCRPSRSTPARLWGVADRVGSLEVGKDADLVVWSGDPLRADRRAPSASSSRASRCPGTRGSARCSIAIARCRADRGPPRIAHRTSRVISGAPADHVVDRFLGHDEGAVRRTPTRVDVADADRRSCRSRPRSCAARRMKKSTPGALSRRSVLRERDHVEQRRLLRRRRADEVARRVSSSSSRRARRGPSVARLQLARSR